MEHIAIMKKSWRLIPKILSGEKKIESRWYSVQCAPWNRIKRGETVYFKDSGEPVTMKAEVENVLQFSDLTPNKVKELLHHYAHDDGLADDDLPKFIELFEHKRYCMLIFLKNPQKIKSFEINKKGFGLMAAWMCVEDVGTVKKL
jgi:ASC-1-like (ASCH) protein